MENNCLTYPTLQKYYNALNNLRELNIQDDIFYNISKIDAFFAEFRNITFIMQKSFNTEDLKHYYEIKRDEILLKEDMKWFVDQRNEVTKQEPFKLEKGIRVEVYLPDKITMIVDNRLTIENDMCFDSICIVLKEILLRYKKYPDVFFCISLSFRENGNEINVYKKIRNGILVMNKFILAVINDYPCSCEKCIQIKEKINESLSEVLHKEMSFIWDCSLEKGEIVFGNIATMSMGKNNFDVLPIDEIRTPLKGGFYDIKDNDILMTFKKFTSMHYICYKEQKKHIMPTFMVIFEDLTFSLIPFEATLKTTFYRMAYKIAKITREKNVIAVFYVGEYYFYSEDKIKHMQDSYSERIKQSEKIMLCSVMIAKNYPSMLFINIDSSKIEDEAYVGKQINSPTPISNFPWFQLIYQSLQTR